MAALFVRLSVTVEGNISFPFFVCRFYALKDQVTVLDDSLRRVESAPHSAASLTLYAMVNTMDYEQAGCLFKLNKLRDLQPDERRLAYALMELMVEQGNRGPAWERAKARMDELVRAG